MTKTFSLIFSIILISVLFFFGCQKRSNSAETLWDKIPMSEFNPVLTSWADSSSTLEHVETIFGRIGDITQDVNYNFYISDLISQNIKVFDSKGTYLHSIGRRGRGAGELMKLISFTLSYKSDGQTSVLITDEVNRVITEFSTDGKLIQSHQIPLGIEYPKGPFVSIESIDHRGYLFQYKLFKGAKDDDCLFHFFSEDFSQKLSCFGSFKDLWYSHSNVYNYLTEAKPGHFILTGEKTIYYTPYLYDGSIYIYRFEEESQEWIFSDITYGFVYERRPINEQAEPFHYRTTRLRRSYYGQINNQSLGLFETPSGLYHFTKIKNPHENYWFGLERYNKEMELQEYIRLSGVTPDDPSQAFVLHQDENGLFYIVGENTKGLPVIKQMSIEFVTDLTKSVNLAL